MEVIVGFLTLVVTVIGTLMGRIWFNHIKHWDEYKKTINTRFDAMDIKLEKRNGARGDCRREVFERLRLHGEDIAAIKQKLEI